MAYCSARIVAAASVATLVAGCASPNLGDVPFLCHNGEPKCPDGYSCQDSHGARVCVRDGAKLDTRAVRFDGATANDGVTSGDRQSSVEDQQILVGDKPAARPKIAITEFMADPGKTSDALGEWIELFNYGDVTVDLAGWTLKDLTTDTHKIAPAGSLKMPPKTYLVLGRTVDKTKNGGVNVAYAYGDTFFLQNEADEIILLTDSLVEVDRVAYSDKKGFVIPIGASLSVKNPMANKTIPESFCEETTPWPGSAGDRGTPGFNPGCH